MIRNALCFADVDRLGRPVRREVESVGLPVSRMTRNTRCLRDLGRPDRTIGRPSDRPVGRSVGRPIPTRRSTRCLAHVGRPAGRPVGRPVGQPVGRSAGREVCRSAGRPFGPRRFGNNNGGPVGREVGRPVGRTERPETRRNTWFTNDVDNCVMLVVAPINKSTSGGRKNLNESTKKIKVHQHCCQQ